MDVHGCLMCETVAEEAKNISMSRKNVNERWKFRIQKLKLVQNHEEGHIVPPEEGSGVFLSLDMV